MSDERTGLNNELRSLWKDAGYPRTMGSAAVIPPPRRRDRRVYYMTSAEYAVSNIVFKRLKVARFSKLNDPFELLSLKSSDRGIRKRAIAFRDRFDRQNGVLCFSEDWTDPVLWSHYGDRHRGVCLGFDTRKAKLKPVSYQAKRLVKKLEQEEFDPDLEQLLLVTKYESWSYEKEQRMLVPLSEADSEADLHFLSFDGDMELTEVILGPSCGINCARMREMVDERYPGVVTFQARLAWNSFQFVPDEKTVPFFDLDGPLA